MRFALRASAHSRIIFITALRRALLGRPGQPLHRPLPGCARLSQAGEADPGDFSRRASRRRRSRPRVRVRQVERVELDRWPTGYGDCIRSGWGLGGSSQPLGVPSVTPRPTGMPRSRRASLRGVHEQWRSGSSCITYTRTSSPTPGAQLPRQYLFPERVGFRPYLNEFPRQPLLSRPSGILYRDLLRQESCHRGIRQPFTTARCPSTLRHHILHRFSGVPGDDIKDAVLNVFQFSANDDPCDRPQPRKAQCSHDPPIPVGDFPR